MPEDHALKKGIETAVGDSAFPWLIIGVIQRNLD